MQIIFVRRYRIRLLFNITNVYDLLQRNNKFQFYVKRDFNLEWDIEITWRLLSRVTISIKVCHCFMIYVQRCEVTIYFCFYLQLEDVKLDFCFEWYLFGIDNRWWCGRWVGSWSAKTDNAHDIEKYAASCFPVALRKEGHCERREGAVRWYGHLSRARRSPWNVKWQKREEALWRHATRTAMPLASHFSLGCRRSARPVHRVRSLRSPLLDSIRLRCLSVFYNLKKKEKKTYAFDVWFDGDRLLWQQFVFAREIKVSTKTTIVQLYRYMVTRIHRIICEFRSTSRLVRKNFVFSFLCCAMTSWIWYRLD